MFLLVLFACRGPDVDSTPADDTSPDSADSSVDDTHDSNDTGEPLVYTELASGSCEAPSDLAEDPLVLDGSLKLTQERPGEFFVELIDLELVGDVVYGVGQGGLMIYDVSDPTDPSLISTFPDNEQHQGISARFHRVEHLGGGVVAVSHREQGWKVIDASDVNAPQELVFIEQRGLEGLAHVDGVLYVSSRFEGLRIYDVSDPGSPVLQDTIAGISSTWELAVHGDWMYAADNVLGVVPFDISSPLAPVMGTPVEVEGRALHVRVAQDHLLVSTGSAGLAVLELDDPAAPSEIERVVTSGSVVMADAADDVLWAVDHQGVTAWDFSDPGELTPIGRETSEQFALAIVAAPDFGAWVGDWNILGHWTASPDVDAPQLQLNDDVFYLDSAVGWVEIPFTNQGGGDLEITSWSVEGVATLTAEIKPETVAPGKNGWLRFNLDASSTGVGDHRVCLSTNDPQDPAREFFLVVDDNPSHLGNPAPLFALEDLDGTVHKLDEQLGHPVVLTYFATW
jgi:hypothetical protein